MNFKKLFKSKKNFIHKPSKSFSTIMPKFNFKSNFPKMKMFKDTDRDGVMNFRDCKPKDKRFHGGEAMWGKLREKNIHVIGTPKEKKHFRRTIERNPELLSNLDGRKTVVTYGTPPEIAEMEQKNNTKISFLGGYGSDKLQGNKLYFAPKLRTDKNYDHEKTFKHEFRHARQPAEFGSNYNKAKKVQKDQIEKLDNDRQTGMIDNDMYNELYEYTMLEKDAYEAENEIPIRESSKREQEYFDIDTLEYE